MGLAAPERPELRHCLHVRPALPPLYFCDTLRMYYATAGQQSLQEGPCIDDYGIGEAAEDISLSRDGLVLLLSAGFKLALYAQRPLTSPPLLCFNPR